MAAFETDNVDPGGEALIALLTSVFTDTSPVLPASWLMALARHAGWALVLACLVLRGWLGTGNLPQRWRRASVAGLAGLLAVAALWPGSAGLAYWLGLAFQIPSLSTVGLAASVVVLAGTAPWSRELGYSQALLSPGTVLYLSVAAVLLGWVMLLDTLALLPLFLYPMGYSAGAVVLLLVLAVLLIALPASRRVGVAALLLAGVFVMTRLPSGNLWDALSDPLLWLFAHGVLVRGLWQRCSAQSALAIEMGADAIDIDKPIHPHPTLGERIGMAAAVANGSCADLPPVRQ